MCRLSLFERKLGGFWVGLCCVMLLGACSRRPEEAPVGDTARKLMWDTGEEKKEVPISLTASDGTGLELLEIDARAVVQAPLAFTEMRLKFKNPEDREREGRFEITLPSGAAISRFAMKIGDQWQEAEVVERQKARQTYEDFLHRRQDPALLEKKAGNQFSARVFPIPAKAEKELIISYSQELLNSPYTLRFAGLPRVEALKAEVRYQVSSKRSLPYATTHRDFTPSGNLVLYDSSLSSTTSRWVGLRHQDLAVVRVVPRITSKREPIRSLTVLFDTSASRALGFAGALDDAIATLKHLREESGVDFELQFVCFDQAFFKAYSGKVSGFGTAQRKRILERGAFGASDVGSALEWVGSHGNGSDRLLLIGDGIVTAGETAKPVLQKKVKALAEKGVRRVDVIAAGGIRDEALLRALVSAGVGRTGVVADSTLPVENIVKKIMQTTLERVTVSVKGADWVWPKVLKGVQSGDAHLIYAGIGEEKPFQVSLDGITKTPVTVHPQKATRPLIERSSAIAQIEMVSGQLEGMEDDEEKAALKQRIVDLSIAHRVLSDYTALLVLETEADYARFNIDRNALTDILVVEKNGVALMHREASAPLIQRGPRGMQKSSDAPAQRPTRARGEEGQMGRRDARKTDNHYGIRGPRDNPDPHMARAMAREVKESAIVDLLGGSGLSGTGRGGGGTGEGTIGLGDLNTIGRGGGGGTGAGYGRGAGGFGGRRGRVPRIRTGSVAVRGALSREVVRRIVRRHINEVKFCYERELGATPNLTGRVTIKFIVSGTGAVSMSSVDQSTLRNSSVENCIAQAVRRWTFPQPDGGGVVIVKYPFNLTSDNSSMQIAHDSASSTDEPRESSAELPPLFTRPDPDALKQLAEKGRQTAYEGKLQEVMTLIAGNKKRQALDKARAWRDTSPGDLPALIALGEALEATLAGADAARVYGSIIDLFPSRADMRRMAGQRLERLGEVASDLVIDTYRNAVKQRPDHPASHRLFAWSLFRAKQYEKALEAMEKGVRRSYPSGRFAGVVTAMKDEMGLIAAAWKAAHKEASKKIEEAVEKYGIRLPKGPSTRFVLHWESDANDVDLHVYDRFGNHVFYQSRQMPTGGHLVADVTTGYGPEYFMLEGVSKAHPYTLQAHYYNRGAMGYGMGTLQIVVHDGKGNLSFSYRPFIVMKDGAYVGLGTHDAPTRRVGIPTSDTPQ